MTLRNDEWVLGKIDGKYDRDRVCLGEVSIFSVLFGDESQSSPADETPREGI